MSFLRNPNSALGPEIEVLKGEYLALRRAIARDALAAFDAGAVPENLENFNKNLEPYVHQCFLSAMVSIASSDGPINRNESIFLNFMFDQSIDVFRYNEIMVPSTDEMEIEETFETTIGFALEVGQYGVDDGSAYVPQASHLIDLFERIGQRLLSCDSHVSAIEIERLSFFTVIAHSKAADLQQQIDGVFDQLDHDLALVTTDAISNTRPEPTLTPIEQCIAELHALVGLASVKKEVETLINLAKIFALRREKGMPVPPLSLHLVFTGNPGTGKTTVARIIAKVYGSLGLLRTGNLVEVDRSGLVGNFVGQTATKTRKVLDTAKGGILFIDEAYSLSRSGDNDYGSEAIEVILKQMEDSRDELVVIVAGYDENMQSFLRSNPGLRSRFPRTLDFPDYSAEEMATIFERMANQSGYHLTDESREVLSAIMIDRWNRRGPDFANARDARNLFEGAISAQANRISLAFDIDHDVLSEISGDDISLAAFG